MFTTLIWGRLLAPPDEPPPPAVHEGELTSEIVDLRLPPPPYDASLLLPRGEKGETSLQTGVAREAMASAWAHAVLHAQPPRLSLRDPLRPDDEQRAIRCNFNASGTPTMRLACAGHVSWSVRGETQHQQTCKRIERRAPAARGGKRPSK